MNNLVEFLQDISNQGWQLWSENGQLCYDAPKDQSTDSILATLKQHKTEILQLLHKIQVQEINRWQPVVFPLTEAQKQFWFLDQLDENSRQAYVDQVCLELEGAFDCNAMKQAIQKIVERHEALRTRIDSEGNFQEVLPAVNMQVPLIDFSNSLTSDRNSQVAEWLEVEVQKPFNLNQAPLLRCYILKLEEKLHWLVLRIHHIINDGLSIEIIFRELAAFYSAQHEGKVCKLEQPMQFREYVEWQNQISQTEKMAASESYWLAKFSGLIPVLDLPTDRSRPSIMTYDGSRQTLKLDGAFFEDIKRVSRQQGCTLFMTLLATYKILLSKLTGDADIVIGTAASGRALAGTENLIGYCNNVLSIRSSIDEALTFSEFLIKIRGILLDDYQHQDYPFPKLLNKLDLERDPSRPVLVSTLFNLDRIQTLPTMSGLKTKLVPTPKQFVPYDLVLDITETEGGLLFKLDYNLDLFDEATIKRWLSHYQTLLEAIVTNAELPISQLSIMTEAERQQILVEWNNTKTDYPSNKCIHQLFEAQVQKTPDSIAVIFEQQKLTYSELNSKANQLAHYLQKLGVKPQMLVGICVERSVEMVVGLLAILKAGGAYVPLDPNYPRSRLNYLISDAEISILLTQEKWHNHLRPTTAQVICLDTNIPVVTTATSDNPTVSITPEHHAYMMYTSGSTGQPKGVNIIHRGVVRLVKNTNYIHLTTEDIFLQLAPISFDAATFEIWGCLLNGGKLVVMPPHQPSLAEIGAAVRQYQVTTLWLTAGLFQLMVEEQLEDLNSLKQLLAGGDVLSSASVQKVVEKLEGCQLINGYGPTENTTFTCCFPVKASSKLEKSVPIGKPISNTQVYILDSNLQPVPIGVAGELHISGDGLATAYYNRSELTAAKFITNPFDNSKGTKLYKTGDLVRYLPDGNIEFLGRIDHQVKIGGYRIETGEIEAILSQHSIVKETVVVAREDNPGDKHLVAYIVPETDTITSFQMTKQLVLKLREYLKQQLPKYMMPSSFVMLPQLPLTSNGKVDRKSLPAPDLSSLSTEFVAPETSIEKALAEIWAEVLNIERVGIYDNFFELRGDSLKMTQVVSRVRETLNVDLPLSRLFVNPTVAQLSDFFETSSNSNLSLAKQLQTTSNNQEQREEIEL